MKNDGYDGSGAMLRHEGDPLDLDLSRFDFGGGGSGDKTKPRLSFENIKGMVMRTKHLDGIEYPETYQKDFEQMYALGKRAVLGQLSPHTIFDANSGRLVVFLFAHRVDQEGGAAVVDEPPCNYTIPIDSIPVSIFVPGDSKSLPSVSGMTKSTGKMLLALETVAKRMALFLKDIDPYPSKMGLAIKRHNLEIQKNILARMRLKNLNDAGEPGKPVFVEEKPPEPPDSSVPQLPFFKSHKRVQAAKIAEIHDFTQGGAALVFVKRQKDLSPAWVETVIVGPDYIDKHGPYQGGYYVRYSDGYESFSPAQAFEEGYDPD